MSILLPRMKDGVPYTSYSQITSWNAAKGFSTGKPGKHEFILQYFMGKTFPDNTGFAQFGTEVEDYITSRKGATKFTTDEKKLLDSIKPLGLFQQEFWIDFKDFKVKGFIDDATPDLSTIRDYKTASASSVKQYYGPEYKQLDVYALGVKSLTKKLPKKMQVVAIERLGNGFRGGRNVMTVGSNIWVIEREVDKNKLKELEKTIVSTVKEISDYYKVYKKLLK